MSKTFANDRCIPWLISQAEVRVDGEPEQVAPAVHALRARTRPPSAFRLKFAGLIALFAASIAFMAGARPARAEGAPQAPSVRPTVGVALGGLGLGALALGRRLDRTAPGVSILCVGSAALLGEHELTTLAAGARRRLADISWPEGHVWMISEAPLAPTLRARAGALGVRCFAPVAGRITEVQPAARP